MHASTASACWSRTIENLLSVTSEGYALLYKLDVVGQLKRSQHGLQDVTLILQGDDAELVGSKTFQKNDAAVFIM